MKFNVTRSNAGIGDNPCCPGVEKELVPRRGKLEETFTIEINTMEELIQLTKEVGHSIIVHEESGWDFDLPELEIYDGYRE